jgi:drug/metabolite transporter (DMT)-like permease
MNEAVTQADSAWGGRSEARMRLAVVLMLVSMALFSANDTMGKWLVGAYSPAVVVAMRSLAALIVLLPLIGRDGWSTAYPLKRPVIQALRVAFGSVEVVCFYTAVKYLPLADAMAFYLAAPIFVAALSPVLLKERVGWRRWTAILVGFVGVIIALGPSLSSLNVGALLAITGTILFSLMTVSTRALGATGDKVLVLWQMVGAFAVGLAGIPFGWTTPSPRDALLLMLLGMVAMGAHICVNRSLKLATAAAVAPYQYTLLVWAMLFGYLVFGDVPSARMLIGSAVIIAAGLIIIARGRRTGRGEPPLVEV